MKRIYALALYAYPREFRQRFGSEMQQVFAARYQREPHLIPGTFADLFVTAIQERFATMTFARLTYAGTALALFFAASLTVVQAFVIPSGSMEPGIRLGDHLIVNKLPHSPQRDELVVFRYPEDPDQTFIKRVIGVPGDRIRMVEKQTIRNGQPLTESYVVHLDPYVDSYRDNFPGAANVHLESQAHKMLSENVDHGEVVVPPGMLFVMGDNRDRSLDSRFFGFVPQANVIGRPWFVYWSYDEDAKATRWDRTLLRP
ncbi:MAG: signal peptidase I [Bryobacteraceae bacterium]